MIAESCNLPWLMAGDFNDHADSLEKRSFTRGSKASCTCIFFKNINGCNLVDLECNGPRFTWSIRGGLVNTLVRLDRAFANPD